ncbi:hypothetical protein Pcinc_044315 [Petrolisthes cinctipes]|uniref:Uncharacterized protein n=1 Tax=Petrolisthes cinctipes TaxID=88211 RepID=A0AAE1BEW8_PETCI|nr:hypothetical protein Pcinc_044315 [Petrolisthes cinctipes]
MREGSAERTNGRPEEGTVRDPQPAHLTNGDSPSRQSPIPLVRDPETSPKPLPVGEYLPTSLLGCPEDFRVFYYEYSCVLL